MTVATFADSPRLYVGTYAKYNNGSIAGEWLDLDDYSDSGEFLEACAKLHADESDPEFMFQDCENLPDSLYCESSASDRIWEWLEFDDSERETISHYWEHIDSEADCEVALERFEGKYDSLSDWAYDYVESTGMLHGISDQIAIYFDFEAFGRDCNLNGDITLADGFIFRNH